MTLTPKLLGATLAAILMPVASTSRAEVPSPEPPGWAMECKNAIVANAQQGVDHCSLLALMVLGQAPDQILAVINEYDGPTSMKGLLDNANEIAWTSPASAELGLIAATGMAALETLGVEQHEIVAQGLRDEAARMADETFLNLLEENSQFGLVAAGDVYKDACAASQTSNQPTLPKARRTDSTPTAHGFPTRMPPFTKLQCARLNHTIALERGTLPPMRTCGRRNTTQKVDGTTSKMRCATAPGVP